VLLAGGSGTRFWPLSRARRPKQFLVLTGRRPLLVETWQRVRKLAPPSRIWIVAPRALATQVRAMLPRLQPANLIVEPSPRDTGPAVGLACEHVARRDPRAVVGVFPTDHVIRDETRFRVSVDEAVAAASRGALVCLGIRPDRPASGFGYLKCAVPPRTRRAVPVARFVEKPDRRRAQRFVNSGNYLWNAGMFVWQVERFLDELRRTAPGIARAVAAHVAGKPRAWTRAERLSVDYAVMERATGVEVVPLDAGWDDVGSWEAAARLREESGVSPSQQILLSSPRSVVFGGERLVALVDAPDLVVVDTEDALLIATRSGAEKVRSVVAELRRRGSDRLL
jgi:mannose-1-phosphate guanylyltransferase